MRPAISAARAAPALLILAARAARLPAPRRPAPSLPPSSPAILRLAAPGSLPLSAAFPRRYRLSEDAAANCSRINQI